MCSLAATLWGGIASGKAAGYSDVFGQELSCTSQVGMYPTCPNCEGGGIELRLTLRGSTVHAPSRFSPGSAVEGSWEAEN